MLLLNDRIVLKRKRCGISIPVLVKAKNIVIEAAVKYIDMSGILQQLFYNH